MLEDSNTSANENFKKLNAELKELNSFIIDSNKSIETNFNERMNSKSQAMSSRLQQMNDTIKNLNANKGANIHKTNSKLEDDVSSLKSQIKLNENNLKELNKKIRK